MAITLGTPSDYISSMGFKTWGLTLIADELFVGDYDVQTSIKVYDINTKSLKRTLTISVATSSLGTDGTNFLVKNTSNQIVTINKTTGATISTKTNTTFLIASSVSFKVDLVNDRIYFCNYDNMLYIKKYSDGTAIASYTIPVTYTSGVDVIDNKYIIVTCFSSNKIYIAPINNNIVTGLTFTLLYTATNFVGGVIYYNHKILLSTYNGNKIQSYDVLGMLANKFLIKQNSNYYTINTSNYDDVTTHSFTPLTLTGGTIPNASDMSTFGFDSESLLTNSMTKGSDTFIPVNKFDNTAVLFLYKPL